MAEDESHEADGHDSATAPADPSPTRPPFHRRLLARWEKLDNRARAAVVVVASVVLVLGIGAIIGNVAEFDEVLDAIRSASPIWLVVCLLGEIFAYLGYILVFWGTTRAANGPKVPFGVVTHGVFVAFGAFAAANAAGGLATNFWILREAGSTTRSAVRRVLTLNTLLYAVFGVGALVVSILVVTGVSDAPLGMALPWLIIVPPCVALGIWLSGSDVGRRAADRITPRTSARLFGDAVASTILVRHMAASPRSHKASLVGPVLNWGGEIVCLWASLRAFGVNLGLPELMLAYAAAYVVTLLPLPAGGAGAIDASLAFGLHAVGVELAPALLATFAYRFFSYWLEIPPALVAVSALPRLRRNLATVKEEHDPTPDPGLAERMSPA
jgi:uncharacterized membrane protein YbhN (UPF0104 family)